MKEEKKPNFACHVEETCDCDLDAICEEECKKAGIDTAATEPGKVGGALDWAKKIAAIVRAVLNRLHDGGIIESTKK